MKNGQKRYVLTPLEASRGLIRCWKHMRCLKQAAEQLTLFIDMFVSCLPDHIRNALAKVALEA